MVEFLAVPLLACLLLTAIHVYLGLHVLARGVIFVDLALAQVAALGVTVAFLAGHPIQSEAAYWYALAFTLGGAALFAGSRARRAPVPQEAIIGIVYAVSAAAAVMLTRSAPGRLVVGWALGVLVSVGGLAASWTWDLPTGATVVVAFGVALAGLAVGLAARAGARATRERGIDALRGAAIGLCAAVGLAGLLLLLAPRMDHWWLDWLEATIPGVRSLFLNGDERNLQRDSVEGAQRSVAELERVRAMQREVQWGGRQGSEDMQERMRQYLAGRAELLAGDRMVLGTLRARARERQRWWIGVPLVVLGAGGAGVLVRRRRATSRCSGRSPCRSSARAARP